MATLKPHSLTICFYRSKLCPQNYPDQRLYKIINECQKCGLCQHYEDMGEDPHDYFRMMVALNSIFQAWRRCV